MIDDEILVLFATDGRWIMHAMCGFRYSKFSIPCHDGLCELLLQCYWHHDLLHVTPVDTERGVNQYQVQFKTFFNLYLNHSTISNEQ
jgi:hypothetical protein